MPPLRKVRLRGLIGARVVDAWVDHVTREDVIVWDNGYTSTFPRESKVPSMLPTQAVEEQVPWPPVELV